MIANAEKLRQTLDEEKEPEVMWKLSFISLVTGGMKLEAAIAHFGIGIATGYKWIRRWNNEGVEGLKRRKIPGRASEIVYGRVRGVKENTESEALLESERGEEACKGTIQGKLFR